MRRAMGVYEGCCILFLLHACAVVVVRVKQTKRSTESYRSCRKADQTRYVRLNISLGFFVGHVYPELIEPDIGEKEIQDCHYTGAQMESANK